MFSGPGAANSLTTLATELWPRGRARAQELLAAGRADAHGSQKREFSSGGLVVSRYAASVRAAQACKALHAARRKAVEQRVNEALEDS